jgi:hypothetical protein
MGELSKRIGEQGERIVLDFFSRIGWPNPSEGEDLECYIPQVHKVGSTSKHGVDLIYSYVCPVLPSHRRNIIVSVKNSQEHDTLTVKARVKEDIRQLACAVECFKRSPQCGRIVNSGGGVSHVENIGLLFKMNKADDTDKSFLGGPDTGARIDLPGSDTICFFENARHDFITGSLNHLAVNFSGWKHMFLHPRNTLTVQADVRRISTSLLPVHSLVGGPLCMRLDRQTGGSTSESALLIYSQESFSIPRFQRLVGIALELSVSWVDVVVVVPDYEELRDKNAVRQVLAGISDTTFASKIRCMSRELLPRKS